MSIYDEIRAGVNERRLLFLSPALPGTLIVRKMYISNGIRDLVFGPWSEPQWEQRCGYLRADLDKFIEGRLLTIAEKPYGGKTSDMKRLDAARDEVWEIRSRDPNPGLRVFGRFADRNLFVALTWAKRVNLHGPGSREWRNAIEECKTEWRRLFPAYPPKTGGQIHDYLSNIVLV